MPSPTGGAKFLEAPKALKKIFGLNKWAPKASEKIFDQPKARTKIWPNLFRGGGEWVGGSRRGRGGVRDPTTPPPPPPVVLSC